MKTKGPGARDGERSFGRHPSNSFTTPDTKRTKGQGPGMANVLLAATHSNSFTTCGLRGQGAGMVNVLLAASPATRSRPRAIKGQEPGLVDVLLQPTEQTRSHRKAEVVNELLWVAAKRTFTSPGPWPLVIEPLARALSRCT